MKKQKEQGVGNYKMISDSLIVAATQSEIRENIDPETSSQFGGEMPKYDFKQLLIEFEQDQRTTCEEIQKSILNAQMRMVTDKVHGKEVRPASSRPFAPRSTLNNGAVKKEALTTKKLFEQTAKTMAKAVETEKQALGFQEKQNALEIAKLKKLKADGHLELQ